MPLYYFDFNYNKKRNITMGMISSEALANDMGLSHKAVKKLILDKNIQGIPTPFNMARRRQIINRINNQSLDRGRINQREMNDDES